VIDKLAIVAQADRFRGRVTEIHTHPCKRCPSAHYPPDPEALDYLAASRADQVGSVFRCGWRNDKACKGYCDFLGVTDEDLRNAALLGAKKEGG
jgi:hypothetical protein